MGNQVAIGESDVGHLDNEKLPDELLGRKLYGNDYNIEQLANWYRDEENGYFNLTNDEHLFYGEYVYDQKAGTPFHARHLPKQEFPVCVALGCARGDDVVSLNRKIGRIIAIEPTKDWWRNDIFGIPAEYRSPNIGGEIDLPDNSVDLVVAFGCLHHVANVEFVISECARILKPGGWLAIREPIISMGDFRKDRVGLTKRERGIPEHLMQDFITKSGMDVVHRSYCSFNPFISIFHKMGIWVPFNYRIVTIIDWMLSELTSFNARYWRPKIWQKFAPSSAAFLAQRQP